MTKLVFLGTAGMVPTKDRNVQSLYLEHEGEGILLDCGEGTQRQMTIAGLSAQKITTILISHWHGDHVAGLLGLIQTMSNFAPEDKHIRLYGPPGSQEYLDHLMAGCVFESRLQLEVSELAPTELTAFHETDDYTLQAILLQHSIPCLGFQFVRNQRRRVNKKRLPKGLSGPLVGKLQQGEDIKHGGETVSSDEVTTLIPARRISFIFDTELCEACEELAQGSEVLVSEAVYTHEYLAKAKQYQHMTARQAAELAARHGVEYLILTHFSQRYKTTEPLEEDAKKNFENVISAEDFLEIEFDF